MTLEILDATPGSSGFSAVYLVRGEKRTAIIDSGPANGRDKVLQKLRELSIVPDYVVLTHIHIDHAGATGSLPGAVYVHPRGARHLADPSMLWEQSRQALGPVADYYGKPIPVEEGRIVAAEDGATIDLGGRRLRIIHTPGHASHHMSIVLEPDMIIFTGDSAGVIVDGHISLPTTPPPFKPKAYVKSLEIMIRTSPSAVALAHFGQASADHLARHLEDIVTWLDKVKLIMEGGTRDPVEIAERLAERLDMARVARSSRIAHLYYNTVAGLAKAIEEGEWP